MSEKSLTFFWRHLSSQKLYITLFIFACSWSGLFGIINAYLIKMFVDQATTGDALGRSLSLPLVLLLLHSELHNFTWRVSQYISMKLIPIAKSGIILELFNKVHRKEAASRSEELAGAHARHITNVAEGFEQIAANISVQFIRTTVLWIASIILMSSIHLGFGVIALLWSGLFSFFSFKTSRRVRKHAHALASTQSKLSGEMVDSFSGADEVMLNSQTSREALRLSSFIDEWKNAFGTSNLFLLKLYFFQGFSYTCFLGAIALLLVKQSSLGHITSGDFAFIIASSFMLSATLWEISKTYDKFNTLLGQIDESLGRIMCRNETSSKCTTPLVIKSGTVLFESITFSYEPTSPLFAEESFSIQGGEKVAIVGKSGAGKSTLIKLLSGQYPLEGGKITIDGQNIAHVTRESLCASLSIVTQNPILFNRSARENILFSRENATHENIKHALKISGLDECAAMDNVASKMSGGERQRIALARAILKDAPILILDEPFVGLDAKTEQQVFESVQRLMNGKTTLMITHHLPSLCEMDRIILVDNGKIIESGTHEELLSLGREYASLWEVQRKSELQYTPK